MIQLIMKATRTSLILILIKHIALAYKYGALLKGFAEGEDCNPLIQTILLPKKRLGNKGLKEIHGQAVRLKEMGKTKKEI